MGFKMPPIFALIGIVCAAVGLIFQIVGVATPGWLVNSGIELGLWKTCKDSVCITFSSVPDWWEAVRAFGILGLLVLVAVVVVGVLMCFMENDKFPLIAAILGFVAAFCILIEFSVYADNSTDSGGKYGYSFALTIVAFLLAIAAGVLFLLAKFKP